MKVGFKACQGVARGPTPGVSEGGATRARPAGTAEAGAGDGAERDAVGEAVDGALDGGVGDAVGGALADAIGKAGVGAALVGVTALAVPTASPVDALGWVSWAGSALSTSAPSRASAAMRSAAAAGVSMRMASGRICCAKRSGSRALPGPRPQRAKAFICHASVTAFRNNKRAIQKRTDTRLMARRPLWERVAR